jgi:hypothetical protein
MADTDVTSDIPHSTNGDTGGGEPAKPAVQDIEIKRDSGVERGETEIIKPTSPTVEKRPFPGEELVTTEAAGVVEVPPQAMNGSAENFGGVDQEEISPGNGAVSVSSPAEQAGLELNQADRTGMEADGATVEADVGAEQQVGNEEISMTVEPQVQTEPVVPKNVRDICESDVIQSVDTEFLKSKGEDIAVAEPVAASEPKRDDRDLVDTKTTEMNAKPEPQDEVSEPVVAAVEEKEIHAQPQGLLSDVSEQVFSTKEQEDTRVVPPVLESKDQSQTPIVAVEQEDTQVAPPVMASQAPIVAVEQEDAQVAPPVMASQAPIVAVEQEDAQVAPPVLESQAPIVAVEQEDAQVAPPVLESQAPIVAVEHKKRIHK